MKNIFLGILLLAVVSCKKEAVSTQDTYEKQVLSEKTDVTIKTLEGEFLYYADAAVFKMNSQVYGVLSTTELQTLIHTAKPYKKQDTDMVWVKIKGKIVPKKTNEEGWPFNVEIKEVIEVKQLATDDNIIIKKK